MSAETAASPSSVEPKPRCVRHAQWEAAATCARCNELLCVHCLGEPSVEGGATLCRACADRSAESDLPRGRTKVLLAIACMVVPNLVIIAFWLTMAGPVLLARQLVRLALELVLAFFIYRGARWARWLTVVLLGLGGLLALLAFEPTMLLLTGVYALAIWLLFAADTVRFLDKQYERHR
jgi:hypothetical protein